MQTTSHDPMHLLATFDPEDDAQPETALQKTLSRTLTRQDEADDTSHPESPNVSLRTARTQSECCEAGIPLPSLALAQGDARSHNICAYSCLYARSTSMS